MTWLSPQAPTDGAALRGHPILCEAEGRLGKGGQITATIPYSSAQSHVPYTPPSKQDHQGGPHPARPAHRQVDAQSWTWTL